MKNIFKTLLKKLGLRKKREYEDMIFELTGPKGCKFKNLRVNRYGWGKDIISYVKQFDKRKTKSIRFIVKVVAFYDEKAHIRNWKKIGYRYI